MIGTYLEKLCVRFLEIHFLKCSEYVVFFFKITQNKVKYPFLFEQCLFFFLIVALVNFLNKTLHKEATTPTSKKYNITLPH